MAATYSRKLAQRYHNVNPTSNSEPYQLAFPGMIHHNVTHTKPYLLIRGTHDKATSSYGVSSKQRVLSPSLLLKRWDLIQKCLAGPLGFTKAQRVAIQRLLRLWAYYGLVYPKASQIAHEPTNEEFVIHIKAGGSPDNIKRSYGCSRGHFWRTIKLLKERGLIQVVNRYVFRHHAQISNLYRLDNLIIVLARYLAEHGQDFKQKFNHPYIWSEGSVFWKLDWALEIALGLSPGAGAGGIHSRGGPAALAQID